MKLSASKSGRERDNLIKEYVKALSNDVRAQYEYILQKRTKGA